MAGMKKKKKKKTGDKTVEKRGRFRFVSSQFTPDKVQNRDSIRRN
jgi:hypothetical protein